MGNPDRQKKPPNRVAIKVFFHDLMERTKLKAMAADAGITVTEYVRQLIEMAVKSFHLTGKHVIFSDAHSVSTGFGTHRPSIAQLLQSCDLQQMAADIPCPVERLEELREGDRPSDKDLSVLAVSSLGLAIEDLELLRHIYFDSKETPCKN